VAVVTESLTCTAGLRLKLLPISPAPQPLVVGAVWSKAGLAADAERFLKFAKEVEAR
jgi:hypothetical protein